MKTEVSSSLFALDVLACPRCGGRLRLIAARQDPHVVRPILAHLHLWLSPKLPGQPHPRQPPSRSPAARVGEAVCYTTG